MARHDKKDMTKRHVKLHRNLDELIACFYIETGLLAGTTTLMEFMEWSHKMTVKPTCATVEETDEVGS
ncbi:hypothetical protein LCGC14_0366940 [marine sediment metagenome]|uniref:Uncharacterized protein n=1 Tax=marine sediment metagenome TaxID=412755 RepID=A0A0F9WEL3_9ZZZZ